LFIAISRQRNSGKDTFYFHLLQQNPLQCVLVKQITLFLRMQSSMPYLVPLRAGAFFSDC
jgi:hypothetical protein